MSLSSFLWFLILRTRFIVSVEITPEETAGGWTSFSASSATGAAGCWGGRLLGTAPDPEPPEEVPEVVVASWSAGTALSMALSEELVDWFAFRMASSLAARSRSSGESSSSSPSDQTQSPVSVRCRRPLVPGTLRLFFSFCALASIVGAHVNRVCIRYFRSLAFLKNWCFKSSVAVGRLVGSF
uniref:Putative secreted protein n=1 Tax=Ixodes ricinus TaxID=34613 RepID=A0A6B0UZP5_IXORI